MILESKIKLLFIFSFLSFFQFGKCQTSKLNSKCDAINKFLNSEEVNNHFTKFKLENDTIVILDHNNDVSECKINIWLGRPVSIISTGPIIDSLKKFTWNHVIGLRRNMFVFAVYRENNIARTFTILNGTTNLGSIVNVKQKKKLFRLGKIENGVQ